MLTKDQKHQIEVEETARIRAELSEQYEAWDALYDQNQDDLSTELHDLITDGSFLELPVSEQLSTVSQLVTDMTSEALGAMKESGMSQSHDDTNEAELER